jgi:hypothetical protein
MPLTAWPNFALILEAVRKAQYEMGLYNFFYCCHGNKAKFVNFNILTSSIQFVNFNI